MNKKIIELRATISDALSARAILAKNNALYKGDYSFNDYVYFPKSASSLAQYARIRVYEKNNHPPRDEKVVLTIKDHIGNMLKKDSYKCIKLAQPGIDHDFKCFSFWLKISFRQLSNFCGRY